MSITITSLRVDYRQTEGWFNDGDCPYIICNIVFKAERDEDYTWDRAKAETEEFSRVLTIDDPKRYEEWLMSPGAWDFGQGYDGYGKAWTHRDPPWRYIEKFDVFWFREWIADCSVTRAAIGELQYYYEHGKLPSVYRSIDSGIIFNHLRTLQSYWD